MFSPACRIGSFPWVEDAPRFARRFPETLQVQGEPFRKRLSRDGCKSFDTAHNGGGRICRLISNAFPLEAHCAACIWQKRCLAYYRAWKVYRAAVAFQPLKVYLAVYHIAGKTRNAFDQKHVDFMVFCVRHHLLKPKSIYGPCRGVFVRIDFYQFPSRVLSDIIGVVILLDLIALFLLILLCADAAVGSNLLFFVGFYFVDFSDNQCLHLPLRSSAGER